MRIDSKRKRILQEGNARMHTKEGRKPWLESFHRILWLGRKRSWNYRLICSDARWSEVSLSTLDQWRSLEEHSIDLISDHYCSSTRRRERRERLAQRLWQEKTSWKRLLFFFFSQSQTKMMTRLTISSCSFVQQEDLRKNIQSLVDNSSSLLSSQVECTRLTIHVFYCLMSTDSFPLLLFDQEKQLSIITLLSSISIDREREQFVRTSFLFLFK